MYDYSALASEWALAFYIVENRSNSDMYLTYLCNNFNLNKQNCYDNINCINKITQNSIIYKIYEKIKKSQYRFEPELIEILEGTKILLQLGK